MEEEWIDDYVTDLKREKEYVYDYEEEIIDYPLRQCVRISYADGSFFIMSWEKELNNEDSNIIEFDENGDLARAYTLNAAYNHYMLVAANYFDAKIIVASENEEITP